MWVTAAAFGLSIIAIAVLRLEGAGKPDRAAVPEKVWAGIVEGLSFVWHTPVLRTLAFVDLAATGLYMPMESVLFPKYFTDRNEPAQLGWVLMSLSIGGLVGALGYAVLSKYMSRRATMLTAVLTLGVAMTVIAFLPPLPVILVLCAVVGLVYGPIAPIYNYVMQTRAPQRLRGRVVGVMGSLAYAAGPLGLILAGPLADAAGLHATFLALSLPMLLLGLVSIFLPALRDLDRSPGRRVRRLRSAFSTVIATSYTGRFGAANWAELLSSQRISEHCVPKNPCSAWQDGQVAHCGRLCKPFVEGRDARGGLLGSEKDAAVRHLQTGGHAQLGKPNRCVGGEVQFLHFEGVKRRQDRVQPVITDRRDKDFGQSE